MPGNIYNGFVKFLIIVILTIITLALVFWLFSIVVAWFRSPKRFLKKLTDPENVTERTTRRIAANQARLGAGGRLYPSQMEPVTEDDLSV
jgi:hypothetical protein